MQNTRRWLVGTAALAMSAQLVLAAPVSAAPGEGSRPSPPPTEEPAQPGSPGDREPLPVTCRPVDFDEAEVVRQRGGYQLVVSGTVPYYNMTVRLTPVTYIQQPEYWEIQVEGCVAGDVVLPALRDYTATLDLEGTMGTKGIKVGEETFDLRATPPAPPAKHARPWWSYFWRR